MSKRTRRPKKVVPPPPPPQSRARRPGTRIELKRAIHELEVYQEEIRIQNQQLVESQRLLEESRDRYVDLYDFAPVAYVTLCPNGIIREINQTGANLLGVSRARALESPMMLFVDLSARREFLKHIQRCRGGALPAATEVILLGTGGRRIDVELVSGPGFEAAPQQWRYPTTVFDLTERKRAEEERRRLLAVSSSERLLRTVLSVLPVGVRVFDASGNVQLRNDASRDIFGELAGLPLSQWQDLGLTFPGGAPPLSVEQLPVARALHRGETVLRQTVELAPANKVLQLSAVPLKDEGGQVVGAVGVSEDVTELRRAESKLREAKEAAETANRVKDNFLAVVSHELKTPLTAILLWARMLRHGMLKDPSTRGQAIESIEQSAQSQLKLVDDLLDVSRIVAGKLRLTLAPTRVREAAEAALAAARPAAAIKRIELTEDLGRAEWVSRIDAERIRQVITNLLGNAIKFTPDGGRVRLAMRRADRRLRIEVTDNGRGITPDFLPHVFDQFRQADPAATRASGGLGLGLSIAKQLVELHGGTIRAQSDGDGRGATFTVELPLFRAAPPPRKPKRAPTPEVDGRPVLRGVRVLLVEDDVDTRAAVRLLLDGAGAEVAAAASAGEGRTLFRTHRPHVVLTDIAMPEENGYQFADSVRFIESQAPNGPPVRFVALTAFASEEDRRRALDAGFAAHLAKPFDPSQLVRLLRRLAKRGRGGSR
jgi:PAS domain S-box-containing protein